MSSDSKTNEDLRGNEGGFSFESIHSPARLHFGLVEVCADQPRLFGGVGVMIEQPSIRMSLTTEIDLDASAKWLYSIEAEEPWKSRIAMVAERWFATVSKPSLPPFTIRLEHPPSMHAGLGSGTQVACSTVSLLNHWYRKESIVSLDELAGITLRGKRSFVGLAGHQHGGFIVDYGQSVSDAPRNCDRLEPPRDWCVVLAKPISTTTISGVVENDYFGQSQAPNPHRESMWKMITDEITPAIETSDLNRFGHALYEYGRYAGRVFARVQGGVYRDHIVATMIEWIRAQGVLAVGQSSWGPTVYAIIGTRSDAKALLEKLSIQFPVGVECMMTTFNHTGYQHAENQ